ncbi:MAG TPA: hypothetical protein VNN07_18565 [Candidatus Tectomicrobia bacterium]|nr:hypothetical protein [Candidatus Tectomicrobia bacterium]
MKPQARRRQKSAAVSVSKRGTVLQVQPEHGEIRGLGKRNVPKR